MIWVLVCWEKGGSERFILSVGILAIVVQKVNLNGHFFGVGGFCLKFLDIDQKGLLSELDICISCSELSFGD